MIGRLPESLTIGNKEYCIRTDYRNILDIFMLFNDDELTKEEKWFCAVYMLYKDFHNADELEEAIEDGFDIVEAIKQALWFINCGEPKKETQSKKPVYDWEQDEQMIFSAINNVAKIEVRQATYIHWWTFLSYFNEIGEGMFTYIVGIRKKKNKGEKLDKTENKFYRENKEAVDLRPRLSKEEQEFMDYISEVL